MMGIFPIKHLKLVASLNYKNLSNVCGSMLIPNTLADSQNKQIHTNNSNFLLYTRSEINAQNYSTEASNDLNKNSNEVKKKDPFRKPTLEQMLVVQEKLTKHLPNFLKETHPYSLYTPDVIFENFYNEQEKITTGALNYALELLKLRWKINIKFGNAAIHILKIGHDEDDGTIKIRWRLKGVRGSKMFTSPWKIKIWNISESIKSEAEWHDGFSILYLRGDGLIYKHRLQRVIANKDETVSGKKNLTVNLNVGT